MIKENDTFLLSEPLIATVIGEGKTVLLPKGTLVTIMLVFGDLNQPLAYEVEAFLPENNIYALTTIEFNRAINIFQNTT